MKIGTSLLGLLVAGVVSGGAHASILSLDTVIEFSAGTPPTGPIPWMDVTIDDGNTPGSVTLSISNTNLVGTEFVSELVLNLDPALDPMDLVFSTPTKTGTFGDPVVSLGTNAFSGGPGGDFDILIDFPQPNPQRFGAGESVEYTITGIATLVADDFDFLSVPGGQGSYQIAAHVQSINGSDSGWVATPEPGSVIALLGAGAILLRRRHG